MKLSPDTGKDRDPAPWPRVWFSFKELVFFLSDPCLEIDLYQAALWLKNVMGDHELTQKILSISQNGMDDGSSNDWLEKIENLVQ